jgi:hypothetical protein
VSDFGDARDAMWDALSGSGMHVECSTVLPGSTEATEFHGKFDMPDVNPLTGMRSADFRIDYRYSDAPTLLEGAEIIVDGVMYRVRQDPEIDAERGADGYFRCAYLTRVV